MCLAQFWPDAIVVQGEDVVELSFYICPTSLSHMLKQRMIKLCPFRSQHGDRGGLHNTSAR